MVLWERNRTDLDSCQETAQLKMAELKGFLADIGFPWLEVRRTPSPPKSIFCWSLKALTGALN